jgi:hypothetical protein
MLLHIFLFDFIYCLFELGIIFWRQGRNSKSVCILNKKKKGITPYPGRPSPFFPLLGPAPHLPHSPLCARTAAWAARPSSGPATPPLPPPADAWAPQWDPPSSPTSGHFRNGRRRRSGFRAWHRYPSRTRPDVRRPITRTPYPRHAPLENPSSAPEPPKS